MYFEIVLNVANILVLIGFGFLLKKYFPIVKNISTWMKDVSSTSKETYETLSNLYDPKEIEKIVNVKVEEFKIKLKNDFVDKNIKNKELIIKKSVDIVTKHLVKYFKEMGMIIIILLTYMKPDEYEIARMQIIEQTDKSNHELINKIFDTAPKFIQQKL